MGRKLGSGKGGSPRQGGDLSTTPLPRPQFPCVGPNGSMGRADSVALLRTGDRLADLLADDYAVYGIDPNERLDDWSFLEMKPAPLPERTPEEQRLLEELMAPAIAPEEIQREVHDRLRELLSEAQELIAEPRPELEMPIDVSEADIANVLDRSSFEHDRAMRLSQLAATMARFAEDSAQDEGLLHSLMSSTAEMSHVDVAEPVVLPGVPEVVAEWAPSPVPAVEVADVPRRARTPEIETSLAKVREIERMSAELEAARRQREEETERRIQEARKEAEAKREQFFAQVREARERHEREAVMEREIRSAKPLTMADLSKAPPPASDAAPRKRKEQPAAPEVPPPSRLQFPGPDVIRAFAIQRSAALKAPATTPVEVTFASVASVTLSTHWSKTYDGNVRGAADVVVDDFCHRCLGAMRRLGAEALYIYAIFKFFVARRRLGRVRMLRFRWARWQLHRLVLRGKRRFFREWREARARRKAARETRTRRRREIASVGGMELPDPDLSWVDRRPSVDPQFVFDTEEQSVSSVEIAPIVNVASRELPVVADAGFVPLEDDLDFLEQVRANVVVPAPPAVRTEVHVEEREPEPPEPMRRPAVREQTIRERPQRAAAQSPVPVNYRGGEARAQRLRRLKRTWLGGLRDSEQAGDEGG